jgi:predicted RNase H-like nuclease (RuvC/YqgF family)
MVQIYLDGLTPRVQKMWEKLGKQPQKLQIKLLDAAAIDEAVAKAKEEKAKKAKEESTNQPAQQEEKEEKKELTPEEITQKEEQIKELQGQIDTALQRENKDMANELYKELPPIVEKFPDAKKKEWQAKLAEIKKKMGG